MRALLIVLLLLPAPSGCGKKKGKPGPVVPAEETAAMEADLMKRVDANRTKQCPRPVLRGQPLPGNADADVLALADPAGPLAACHKAVADGDKAALDALRACDKDGKACRPRALDDPTAAVPEIAAIEAACGDAFVATLARAVSHEDSCSPYLAGRRPAPLDPTLVRIARAAVIRARALARDGRDADAVRVLFDVMRLGQDLGRGGPALIASMLGVAMTSLAYQGVEAVLARRALVPADLDALIAEAEKLAGSDPSFGEMLAGERDAMELYVYLAGAKPADWAPPGGWATRNGKADRPSASPEAAAQVGLLLASSKRAFEEALKVCPPGKPLAACRADLKAAEQRLGSDEPRELNSLLAEAGKVVRLDLETKISAIVLPTYTGFVGKVAEVPMRVAATRLQLALQRRGAAGEACPNAAALTAGDLASLLRPDGLGDALVAHDAPGGLELRPPAWAAKAEPMRVACPPAPAPAPRTDK